MATLPIPRLRTPSQTIEAMPRTATYESAEGFSESLQRLGADFSPEVLSEAAALDAAGEDVRVVDTPDVVSFPGLERRKKVIELVTRLMVRAAGIYDPDNKKPSLLHRIPTGGRWNAKTGTALAINAGVLPRRSLKGEQRRSNTFAGDLSAEAFTDGMFIENPQTGTYTVSPFAGLGRSAAELMHERGKQPEEVAETVRQHRDYLRGKVGPIGRIFFDGLADMEGVRTRMSLGVAMMREALADHPKEEPLRLASIGCGSSLPVIEIIKALEKDGYSFEKYHLVDQDPMALAAAVSAIKNSGLEHMMDKIEIHIGDVGARGDGIPGIPDGSIHAADALGLYEYLRKATGKKFLQNCMKLLGDGGSLCLSNMHPERKQRAFFENLIRWNPSAPVQMRSLTQMLDNVKAAGYSQAMIRLGNRGSLYPGYIAKK